MKPTFKIFCFCPRLVAPALVSFLIVLAAAKSGRAAGGGTGLQLSPNVYATPAGGQITLRGSFNFFGPFTSVDDGLLGLSPASPHLGIVAGSVLSSQNNNPPVNGAYFFDRFSGGYLGPTTGTGPVTTGIINLRTFVIPAGTPPGTYHYAYGVSVAASIGPSPFLTDMSLTIIVAPSPVDLSSITNPLFSFGLLSPLLAPCPVNWDCLGSPSPGFATYFATTAQYPGGTPFLTSALSPTVYGGSGIIRQLTSLNWIAGTTNVLNLWAGLPKVEPDGTTPVSGWPQAPNGAARLYLTMGSGFGQVAAFDIPSPGSGSFASNPISVTLPSNSSAIGQRIGVMIFVSAPSLFSANFDITPVAIGATGATGSSSQ